MFTSQQATIKKPLSFSGKGLHLGKKVKVTLVPAKVNNGIRIIHKKGTVPFKYPFVTGSSRGTNILISDSFQISTVEHLISALVGLGIDNCDIEITGNEVPATGGSAKEFATKIIQTGITLFKEPKSFFEIKRPICFHRENKSLIAIPANNFKATVFFDFPDIPTQTFSFDLSKDSYLEEIAPARTFGFAQELTELRANGYIKGADLSNAILIDGLKSSAKDIMPEELVRHKILDLIGDLFALGSLPKAHIIGIRCGHEINSLFVKELLFANAR